MKGFFVLMYALGELFMLLVTIAMLMQGRYSDAIPFAILTIYAAHEGARNTK